MSKIKRHPWLVVTLVLAIALLVTIPALAQAVSSDLVVTKAVDNSTPYDGATIRYTITAANNGPDVAPVVTVTDLLPAGVTYVADSGGGVYSSTTGIWSISSLITTTPTTLVITGTVSAANGTVITNTATVTGTVVDPNLADNSASAVLTVVNLADLAVTKAVDNPAPLSGGTIRYTLSAVNNGPNAATAVSVADLLPAGVTYVADNGGGVYSSTTGIWTIGALAVGTPSTLNITATVGAASGTVITNTATIAGAEVDANPANNSASAVLTVAAAPPPGTTLPATTCTLNGAIRTCDLWATTGTVTMPDGVVVTIWGYTDTVAVPASIPGPMIIANQGETVVVNLHNNLAEPTALLIDEQDVPPDLVGAAPGATKTYTFTASAAGTYLYEAGLLPNAQHQVAMGLYGAFIVRPAAAGQAYDDPATAYNDEALLVLSEIDPALNNNATPAAFDMRYYAPMYWLINGKAYPNTAPILTSAGNKLLLRYVNAGLEHHSMTVLGLGQTVIAQDGSPLVHSYRLVADSIAEGQTEDTLVMTSASAVAGSKFALYDGDFMLHNGGATGLGGMLTFVTVMGTPPGGDLTGPTTSAVVVTPNPTTGLVDLALSATVSDAASGNANVTAAEYFIDILTADGTGTAMSGAFASPVEAVQATIPAAVLAGLPAGNHLIYVHGQDALGNWGALNFAVLYIESGGPATVRMTLKPNPSNGSRNVVLNATADDTATGNGNTIAAEYFIDTPGADGSALNMTVNYPLPIASLDATIPAATVAGLAEGVHPVYVHAQDDQGNWGPLATIDLLVDKTGPATTAVSVKPSPNNGTLGVNSNVAAVRVRVTVDDPTSNVVQSNVRAVEGFIDTVGADGSGFPLVAADSVYNSPTENAYGDIPLTTVALLSEGPHTIYVHGQDASRNWGATTTLILVVDRTAPVVSSVNAAPNPTGGAASVALTATATDTASNVARAEWFVGADPGPGFATPMAVAPNGAAWDLSATIDVSTWANGPYVLSVRAQDAAGNWSAVASTTLNVGPADIIFADSFQSGNVNAWTSSAGTGLSVIPAAAQDGDGFGLQVVTGGPSYVLDGTPANETSYHARFYFNPVTAVPGSTTQAITILQGRNAANTILFQVQYRWVTAGGGTYQVRAAVASTGGTSATSWYPIATNAWHPIEIAWQSGTVASFTLYVDGAVAQTLTGLNTSAYLLDTVRLGSATNVIGSVSRPMYFDAFVSTRFTVIGP